MIKRIFNKLPFIRQEIKAGHIMTENPATVTENTTAQNIAKLMSNRRVGTVMVVKGDKAIGIVTDTDLTKRVVAHAKDPRKLKANDVMSKPLIFSKPGDSIEDVISKMRRHRIKRIPVIENEKLIGIISTTDVAKNAPAMMDLVEARIMMREEKPTFLEAETSGVCESCGNYSERLHFQNDQWVCRECRE